MNHPDLFERALVHMRQGRPELAERMLHVRLAANRADFEATYTLGLVFLMQDRHADALPLLQAAVHLQPGHASARFNLGKLLHIGGQADQALPHYREVNRLTPDDVDGWLAAAGAAADLGQADEALAHSDRALALDRRSIDAWCLRGNALAALGRAGEAPACYEEAVRMAPGLAPVWCNYGAALNTLGDYEGALEKFDRALALAPELPQAWANRGKTLFDLGRHQDAYAAYDRALKLDPRQPLAWSGAGAVMRAMRKHDAAIACYDHALALQAGFAEAWYERADAQLTLLRYEEALHSFERAIALKADFAQAWAGKAAALHELGRHEDAIAAYTALLEVDPNHDFVPGRRLMEKLIVCDWTRFDADVAAIAAGIAAGRKTCMPFDMLAIPLGPELQRQCARSFAAGALADAIPAALPAPVAKAQLTIAYFSSDFREHPVGQLIAGLLSHHDRSRFRILGFALLTPDDGANAREIRAALDELHDVSGMDDAAVAALARSLGVDIAVDLNGYTRSARPRIFAHRAAPLQMSYLGYAATSAAPCIDYLVADVCTIPPAEAAHYSEHIVRLPDTFFVTHLEGRTRKSAPTRASQGLPGDAFVFCCFNGSFKITPDVFAAWMEIVRNVPGSVLWLSATNPLAVANLRREAEARGVEPTRLVFTRRVEDFDEHLARMALADLFLDTFHYNAHVTASDALWAGIPILTCPSRTFAGRVAASLLHATGVTETIVADSAAYITLAITLARDGERLRNLRARLAANRGTHALFRPTLLARHLEEAYVQVWARACAGEAPAAIAVPKLSD